jgi:cyclic pyranopterin phosphate synthase
MRCLYCRPASHGQPRGKPMLSIGEIELLVSHLARYHGLKKVRLTGGDPTNRPDLIEIIHCLSRIPGIHELVMTTNGLTLARQARAYAAAGLQRINVSLDSLQPERFEKLTGVNGLDRVLAGLDAAERAGLTPLRLNTVVVRDCNDGELPALVDFAAERGCDIRFIELMPMGPLAHEWHQRYVPESQMRDQLAPVVQTWQLLDQKHDAARRYRVTLHSGRQATIGFITPMSCNFCAACNRIRIAADGTLYPCLMNQAGPSLLPALRPDFDGMMLDRLIGDALQDKLAEHPLQGPVAMIQLGG